MTVLLGLLAAAAVVAGLVVLVGFVTSRTVVRGNAQKALAVLGPPGPSDLDESAAQLAPQRVFGLLRLTDDAVVFADGSGAVTTIPRLGLTATVTAEPGSGGRLRRPCLVLAGPDGARAFAVADPDDWVRRLQVR